MLSKQIPLGIYEKRSLPGSAGWSACGWRKRWVLTLLKCRWTRPTPDWRGSTGVASSAGAGERGC